MYHEENTLLISMSVASHLKIKLAEYDNLIPTFIPYYSEMLETAAGTLRTLRRQPTIVDLGIGTGALSARCLKVVRDARLVGIDADGDILALATRRLGRRRPHCKLVQGSFLETPLPRCDAIVASLALHHIHSAKVKAAFYMHAFATLRQGGMLVNADCCVASDAALARLERTSWRAHLQQTYSARETSGYFEAWASEDRYFPLEQELAMLRAAGFRTDVAWRRSPFAVVVGRKGAPVRQG